MDMLPFPLTLNHYNGLSGFGSLVPAGLAAAVVVVAVSPAYLEAVCCSVRMAGSREDSSNPAKR